MDNHIENDRKPTTTYYFSTYSRDDAPEIVRSLSNPLIAKQLRMVPTPYTMSNALEWFDNLEDEANHPDTAPIRWALRDKSSHKLIGDTSLRPTATCGTYSMGYWLAYEYWGQGIMTMVVSEVLDIVRKEIPKVKVVTAMVRELNGQSQRVLEKNGFQKVGEHMGTTVLWDYELKV